MTTNQLMVALKKLPDGNAQHLIKELQVRQRELEIQNRELRQTQQQLAHSRLRYADLYDFSPIGYVSINERGAIEEINLIGGKLIGENPHKLIGRLFTDFLSNVDARSFKAHLQQCRSSRKRRSVEVRLMPTRCAPIDVQIFTLATRDADRHTLQFRTAMIDITMRKRAEAAVHETQTKLEQLVAERTAELTSERRQREEAQRFLYETGSVLSMSLDYEITSWTVVRSGIPHLADGCVLDLFQEDGAIRRVAVAHIQAAQERALWDTEHVPLATDVIRSGQPEVDERTITVPIVIRGNTIGAVRLILERDDRTYNRFDLALAEDLADRAAIALDNATLYTKELEANRLKDEFLAIVSHELRTPLTPVLGAIYKLRQSKADDKNLQSALDLIERNVRAEAGIVEELLDVSRIATGKFDFKRKPEDLLSIVQSAVEVVRPSTHVLGIELHTRLEPPPRLISCDRGRIQQVIWNLLSNAMKFTKQGGNIEVQLDNSPGWAHIRVSDNGVGISREFLPHIFDLFRQGGSFVTRNHGGLGVGLSIVRYIVERHGGRVIAESRGEGQGATFVVDLAYA